MPSDSTSIGVRKIKVSHERLDSKDKRENGCNPRLIKIDPARIPQIASSCTHESRPPLHHGCRLGKQELVKRDQIGKIKERLFASCGNSNLQHFSLVSMK